MRARIAAALGWMVLTLTVAPLHASADESAQEVVANTVAEVLAVLQTEGNTETQSREQIEEIAYARFDFDAMGKLVLARGWKKFDERQRAEFIVEFKRHLSRSYGTRISRYEQEKVDILSERKEKRGDVTVLTAIRGGQFDGAEVNYRMRDREGAWRVIDVIIEGVSLVSNFRSQFKDIVLKDGADGLIAQLRAKNESHDTAGDDVAAKAASD